MPSNFKLRFHVRYHQKIPPRTLTNQNQIIANILVLILEMAERHDAKAVLNLARNIVHKLQEVMHPIDHN